MSEIMENNILAENKTHAAGNNTLPVERFRKVDFLGRSIASGGRKRAVASVILSPGGTGKVIVNKKEASQVFKRQFHLHSLMRPLNLCGNVFDVVAKVIGGGKTGQAEAISLAISLAMIRQNPTLYPSLRREGLISRDPRKVEPKKTGYPKAKKQKPTSRR